MITWGVLPQTGHVGFRYRSGSVIRRLVCFCWGLRCMTTTTNTTLPSYNSQSRAIKLASSDRKGVSELASSPLFLWFHFCMSFLLLLKATLWQEVNKTIASCFFESPLCVLSGVVSAVSCRCPWYCVEDNKRVVLHSSVEMREVFILLLGFPKPKLHFCVHQSFADAPKTLWEVSRQ